MKNDFKVNLRATLDSRDLTVKELSAKTGIPNGTLNCYLGARASMPPADIAAKIANALDVTVEYLVTSQEPKKETAGENESSINEPTINEPTIDEPALPSGNGKSIIQILIELNERDVETIHALSKILEARGEKEIQ